MGKCYVDPNALLAVAGMLAAIANGQQIGVEPCKPTARKKQPCGCGQPLRDEFGRFTSRAARPCPPAPAPRWGVCGEPKEDKNKVFGLSVRVDEPTPDMFNSRLAFERAHAKFDRLVDAVEAVDWQNKSNTAPLHKVNCIRKRIQDGPVFGVNLVGETRWFE